MEAQAVQNAASNQTVPVRTVLADLSNTLHAESDTAASAMSSLKSLQMKIFRARNSKDEKLPKSVSDLLDMPDKYKKLDSGEDFLLAAEDVGDNEVLLIYMSSFGERILKGSPLWLCDGTFRCVPNEFGQLYVIHGSKENSEHVFPACYCLLPNKLGSTYNRMFDIIKTKLDFAEDKNIQIYVDFEAAVINSLRLHFPNCSINGCNFHWKKRIFENVG